jgi:hypothetical protein
LPACWIPCPSAADPALAIAAESAAKIHKSDTVGLCCQRCFNSCYVGACASSGIRGCSAGLARSLLLEDIG